MANEKGNQSSSLSPPIDGPPRRGEHVAVWTIWLTYGAFYFCRTNLGAAVPGMEQSVDDGGLGLSGDDVARILAILKITYGVGQLINGQLAERVSPRVLLSLGMFGSAALNVLFGLGTGFYFLLFVWACNGYCQSLGWTPSVRVVANWVPMLRRGKALGIVGTGYQLTQGATFYVASLSADYFGWRGAVFVPSVILCAAGLIMLLFLRDAPEDTASARMNVSTAVPRAGRSLLANIVVTLSNPALWLLGLSLGLLNACRYGFVDWGISHLVKVQESTVGAAGLKYVVLAIGATLGSYLSGWATDRFFGGRRAPVICIMLTLLGILTLFYDQTARTSASGTVLLLMLVGFCIYGPQVLLVGTAPADLAKRGTAAAAAGFVDFMGYVGAALGDRVTGHYKQEQHGGWEVAIYFWAGSAFAAAIITALLWYTSSRSGPDLSPQPALDATSTES